MQLMQVQVLGNQNPPAVLSGNYLVVRSDQLFSPPARALAAESLKLERTLSNLVNQACGLAPAERFERFKARSVLPNANQSMHRIRRNDSSELKQRERA